MGVISVQLVKLILHDPPLHLNPHQIIYLVRFNPDMNDNTFYS